MATYKSDEPPAYHNPQAPQAAYAGYHNPQDAGAANQYYQSAPPMAYNQQPQYYGQPQPGGYPNQGYPQGPYQQGPYQGQYQQGPYQQVPYQQYPPQERDSGSGGILKGCLAAMACCCCLDILF